MSKLSLLHLFHDTTITHLTVGNAPRHGRYSSVAPALHGLCARCTSLTRATLHTHYLTPPVLRVLLSALSLCSSVRHVVICATRPLSVAAASALASGLRAFARLPRAACGYRGQHAPVPPLCAPVVGSDDVCTSKPLTSAARAHQLTHDKHAGCRERCHRHHLAHRGTPLSRRHDKSDGVGGGCTNVSPLGPSQHVRANRLCGGGIHLRLDLVELTRTAGAVIVDAVRRSERVVMCELRVPPSSAHARPSLTRFMRCCSRRLQEMARRNAERLCASSALPPPNQTGPPSHRPRVGTDKPSTLPTHRLHVSSRNNLSRNRPRSTPPTIQNNDDDESCMSCGVGCPTPRSAADARAAPPRHPRMRARIHHVTNAKAPSCCM